MADREVKVRISGDASSAVDAFDKAKKSAGDFEKSQASLISSIKGQWLAASAAIATATMAINKAWDMAKVGAAYSEQYGILDNLAQKYKTTADAMIKEMQRASDGQIAKIDLVNTALGGLGKGLNPDQLINLSNAARTLGDIAGEDATTAIQKLTEALETGRTRGIKAFTGNTIDLDEALGDLTKVMSEAEKTQYRYNNLMIHTAELEGQMTKAVDDSADRIDRINARWKDLTTTLSVGAKSAIFGVIDAFKALAEAQSNVDISGMSGVDTYVAPKANKSAKKLGGTADQNLAVDQLAMLDNVLLKRNLAMRKTEEAVKASAKTVSRIDKQASKDHEFIVDLYIKDEAKKWEALEKFEKDYAAAQKNFEKSMRAYGQTDELMNKQADELAPYQKLLDEKLISDEQYQEAKKNIEDKYRKERQKLDEMTEKEIRKAQSDAIMKEIDDRQQSFGSIAASFREMSQLYAEDSRQRKILSEMSKAAMVAEIAMQAQKNLMIAVGAVVQQGTGDPYSAFARMAAMIALVSNVLSIAGISFGSGGSGGSSAGGSSRKSSTALGSDEASQSVSKSYDLLKDSYNMQFTKLTGIYNQLKDLNQNITGLVTSIVRTGGFTAGMGIKTGTTSSYWANAGSYHINQNLGILSTIGNFLNAPAAGVIKFLGEGIFGGGTTTKIKERGLAIDSATLADILSGGVSAQQYAKLKTTTDGGWFGSDKTSYSYKYQDLDSGVSQMLNLVFQSLGSSIVSLSEAFGVDTKNALDYVFKETKLNLKGMTSEEMNTAISEYISTISDNAAQALFGDLIGKYQQLNEGLMETATRVLRNKEIIAEYLEKTNQAFTGTTEQIIGFTESLVDLGGTLDDLTENINTYINAFYSEAEQQAMLQQDLMEAMGGNMPGSRAGFRAMVEGLDLTTEAGQRAYVTMMNLAGSFDKYFSYIEDEAEKATEAARQARLEQISSEYDLRSSALTEAYNKNLEAAQANLSAITEIVNKLSSARERMKIQDAAIEAAQFRGAKANLMRGIWTDASLDTLTGINPGMYSTRRDYLKDYYDIYNQLGALESDALAQQSAAERTVDWLKRQYDLDLQNLELQRTQAEALVAICNQCTGTKISGYAEGGVATGWALVGEKGPELVNFGKASRVYNNSESRSLMSNSELIAEVKALREEVRAGNTAVAGWTYKTYRTLDKFDYDGLPATRT